MKKSILLLALFFNTSVMTSEIRNYKVYRIEDTEYVEKKLYLQSKNNASKQNADAKFKNNLEQAQARNDKFSQIMKSSNKATPTKKAPVIGSAEWIAAKNS
jgi:hypothetical protein